MRARRFIYFAKEESSGLTKIGISRHPRLRAKALGYQRKSKIGLVHVVRVSIFSGYKFERIAHWKAIEKHVIGEWFRLDSEDVQAIAAHIREAVSSLNGRRPAAVPQLPWNRRKVAA